MDKTTKKKLAAIFIIFTFAFTAYGLYDWTQCSLLGCIRLGSAFVKPHRQSLVEMLCHYAALIAAAHYYTAKPSSTRWVLKKADVFFSGTTRSAFRIPSIGIPRNLPRAGKMTTVEVFRTPRL